MPSAKFEITKKCKFCNKNYIAKVITSVYCSPNCSKAGYRKKKRLEKLEKRKLEIAKKVPKNQEYISVSNAVALYDVSRDTLYRLIKKEQIKSYNLGTRLIRVCREDLEKQFDLMPITKLKDKKVKEIKVFRLEKEDCYTIGEITKKFGISETTVYTHIRKYSIPTRQMGKYVYAPKTEIDNLYKG